MSERERSVLRHLPLVRSIARGLRRRAPQLDADELVSAGTIGLLEAIDRYDDGRGVSFGSFAYRRIKGAMLDELRFQARARAADVDPQLVSLDGRVALEEGDVSLIDVTEDPASPAPEPRAELVELFAAVDELPAREREMLMLETTGYTVTEIADVEGCSVARASQLLSQARLRLRERTAA